MNNIQSYWGRVVEVRSGLPETVWLTSLDVPERGIKAGVTAEVGRQEAALLLVGKSHRLATPEEVEAYKSAEEIARVAAAEAEYKRKQHFAMPKELATLVELAAKAAQAAAEVKASESKRKDRANERTPESN